MAKTGRYRIPANVSKQSLAMKGYKTIIAALRAADNDRKRSGSRPAWQRVPRRLPPDRRRVGFGDWSGTLEIVPDAEADLVLEIVEERELAAFAVVIMQSHAE